MLYLTIIAACARNGVIGRNNQIPWNIPEDLAFFKKMTMGSPILMGRKTYESIGHSLLGRRNIVLTKNPNYIIADCEVSNGLNKAIQLCENAQEIFVIGGAKLFFDAIKLANRLLITEIDAEIPGDTYFPKLDHRTWNEVKRETHHLNTESYAFSFVEYRKSI